jgi:hypothetical protein
LSAEDARIKRRLWSARFLNEHISPLVKWFQALELFLLPDGISAMRLSLVIQVTYKTAWLMLHSAPRGALC